MFTVMLSEKLLVKTFAAAIHAACAAGAFAPKLELKLAVKVGLITKPSPKAGTPEARAIPVSKIPKKRADRFIDASSARDFQIAPSGTQKSERSPKEKLVRTCDTFMANGSFG